VLLSYACKSIACQSPWIPTWASQFAKLPPDLDRVSRPGWLLGAALDAWEEASTPFSDKELDAAAKLLGVTRHARGTAA